MSLSATFTPEQNTTLDQFHSSAVQELQQKKEIEQKAIYTDRNQLARILVAREFNVEQALEMWRKWIQWRAEFRVDSIRPKQIEGQFRSGKAFLHKHDKLGNPVLIVKVRYHDPEQTKVEDMMRFIVFLIERALTEADKPGGTGRITVIYDREGFTDKNTDKRFATMMKSMSSMLQAAYAERLHKTYVLKPSFMMRMMFGMVRPFLAQKVQAKVKIIMDFKEFQEFFEPDCLLPEYGGTSTYVYNPVKEYRLDEPEVEENSGEATANKVLQVDQESYYTMLNDSQTFFAQDQTKATIGNSQIKMYEEDNIYSTDVQNSTCCSCQIQKNSDNKCNLF